MNSQFWLSVFLGFLTSMAGVQVGKAIGYRRGKHDGFLAAIDKATDFACRNKTSNWAVGEMLGRFANEPDAKTRNAWAMDWLEKHCKEFQA